SGMAAADVAAARVRCRPRGHSRNGHAVLASARLRRDVGPRCLRPFIEQAKEMTASPAIQPTAVPAPCGAGRRIESRGIVQGVGFRPWVYRLAHEEGITGRVRNDDAGVTIEAF